MAPSALLLPVLLPLAFWAAYHYYHDRHRPEPVLNLCLCLLLGVVAAYLNRGMYAGLGMIGLRYDALELAQTNLSGLFAYAVLGIGITEELAKLLPFLLVVLRLRAFDEPGDGIVYATFIALGFSTIEMLHFLPLLEPAAGVARGFAAPVVHIVFASIWGWQVGRARLAGRSVLAASAVGLAIAASAHGVYDFIVLGFPGPALLVAAALVVGLWVWRLRLVLKLNADNSKLRPAPGQ